VVVVELALGAGAEGANLFALDVFVFAGAVLVSSSLSTPRVIGLGMMPVITPSATRQVRITAMAATTINGFVLLMLVFMMNLLLMHASLDACATSMCSLFTYGYNTLHIETLEPACRCTPTVSCRLRPTASKDGARQ
jgi:hypothetical protein